MQYQFWHQKQLQNFLEIMMRGMARALLLLVFIMLGIVGGTGNGLMNSGSHILGMFYTPIKIEKTLLAPKTVAANKDIEPLQVPIFNHGKPALALLGWQKGSYIRTQDFGSNGHFGEDYGIYGNPNPGYEVRPITEGTVVFAGWTGSNSWGNSVLIRHKLANGKYYYSQYSHLYTAPFVATGQPITKATVIGFIGSTGHSTGPHLDFQIKEIPTLKGDEKEASRRDLGFGNSEGHRNFWGDVTLDPRNGHIYYRPSLFIQTYNSSIHAKK